MKNIIFSTYFLSCYAFCLTALAEHPIDVQRFTAEGAHFESLVAYEKIPKRRRTREADLAAAKSAWAIGLVSRAKEDFEGFLRSDRFSMLEKAKIEIDLAIIEYQENNYEIAMLYAERAAQKLDAGFVRAQSYLVWGDSLVRQKLHGRAEKFYQKALEEGAGITHSEIHYRLGSVNLQLGKYKEAERYYKKIPLDSERIPYAIKELAKIALHLKKYELASFWLKKGKDEYPDNFLDSWVSFAELNIAASDGDIKSVRVIRAIAEKKYPPSDHWLTLLQANAEEIEWAIFNKDKDAASEQMKAQPKESYANSKR